MTGPADGTEMIRAGLRIARQVGDGTEAARCQLNLTEMHTEARQPRDALLAGEEGNRSWPGPDLVGGTPA